MSKRPAEAGSGVDQESAAAPLGQPQEPPLNGESPSHCDHCRREVGGDHLAPIPTQPGYWWCIEAGPCSDAFALAQIVAAPPLDVMEAGHRLTGAYIAEYFEADDE